MRKCLSVLLIFVLILSLFGCGNSTNDKETNDEKNTSYEEWSEKTFKDINYMAKDSWADSEDSKVDGLVYLTNTNSKIIIGELTSYDNSQHEDVYYKTMASSLLKTRDGQIDKDEAWNNKELTGHQVEGTYEHEGENINLKVVQFIYNDNLYMVMFSNSNDDGYGSDDYYDLLESIKPI